MSDCTHLSQIASLATDIQDVLTDSAQSGETHYPTQKMSNPRI